MQAETLAGRAARSLRCGGNRHNSNNPGPRPLRPRISGRHWSIRRRLNWSSGSCD